MPTLTLIRGLPGAGKTTLALTLGCAVISADDYFTAEDGSYHYRPWDIQEAHADCRIRFEAEVRAGRDVAVANTFTQQWEMRPYRHHALLAGYDVRVISLFDAGLSDLELAARCVHGVPVEKIALMRARWEP